MAYTLLIIFLSILKRNWSVISYLSENMLSKSFSPFIGLKVLLEVPVSMWAGYRAPSNTRSFLGFTATREKNQVMETQSSNLCPWADKYNQISTQMSATAICNSQQLLISQGYTYLLSALLSNLKVCINRAPCHLFWKLINWSWTSRGDNCALLSLMPAILPQKICRSMIDE